MCDAGREVAGIGKESAGTSPVCGVSRRIFICFHKGSQVWGLFHAFHHVTEKGFADIFHVGLVVDVEQL